MTRNLLAPLSAAAAAALALLAAACGKATDSGGGDNGPPPSPAPGCEVRAAPAGFRYPEGPYGSQVGNTFNPSAIDGLQDCEGTAIRFNDVLTSARLVLFNVGAGWCEPCIDEAEVMEAHINQRFCARGLRILQAVFEDERAQPATSLFCREWRDEYGLSFTVVRDPLFKSMEYFPGGSQTPLNLLIDSTGEVRYRSTGVAPTDLDEVIDELLPQ